MYNRYGNKNREDQNRYNFPSRHVVNWAFMGKSRKKSYIVRWAGISPKSCSKLLFSANSQPSRPSTDRALQPTPFHIRMPALKWS